MNKHLTRLFTASSALALILAACGPQTTLVQPDPHINGVSAQAQKWVQEFEQQGQGNVQILDVGKGKKQTSAAIAINFTYANSADFSTKTSQNGWEGKTFTDLNRFHVYLLECDSNALPTADPLTPPDLSISGCDWKFDGHVDKVGGFSGNQVFIFDNVDVSSPPFVSEDFRYYVAIAAEENTTFNNITGPISGFTIGSPAPSSNGPVALSNSGGNGSGGVKIEAGYVVKSGEESSLGVNISLQSDQGAFIDSNVVVAPGSTTYTGSVGVQ